MVDSIKSYTVTAPTTYNARGTKVYALYEVKNMPVDRPYVCFNSDYAQENFYIILADNIHQWFIENNIEYELDFGFNDWLIILSNIDHAVLFKLIWS